MIVRWSSTPLTGSKSGKLVSSAVKASFWAVPGVSNDASIVKVRVRNCTTVSSVTFPLDGAIVVSFPRTGVGEKVPLLATDGVGAIVSLLPPRDVGETVPSKGVGETVSFNPLGTSVVLLFPKGVGANVVPLMALGVIDPVGTNVDVSFSPDGDNVLVGNLVVTLNAEGAVVEFRLEGAGVPVPVGIGVLVVAG